MKNKELQVTKLATPSSNLATFVHEVDVKPQQAFTITGTAELLACSVPTIYRLIRDKKLKTFRVGADQRVLAGEISRIQSGEAA